MKSNLKLERIGGAYEGVDAASIFVSRILGDKSIPAHRDWVAEITGRDPKFRYARKFLNGKIDYANANSKGSRGVYANYILEDGHIYEVAAPVSWGETVRYFCTSVNGDVIKISSEDVEEWLKTHSE